MTRKFIAPSYSADYLQIERPSPLTDNAIEQCIQDVLFGKMDHDISDQVYTDFKKEMTSWLLAGKLNNLTGFDTFDRVDIINGCTQFIDTMYMRGKVQVIQGDYKYHYRLGNWHRSIGKLEPGVPLIIAMPFPSTGAIHTQMKEILDEARDKGIDIHVDGAWLTCGRGIDFDVSHSAIKSVSISLSKGLGLGWNRIGLRWTRERRVDAITIMNDFNMNLRATAKIGLHFIRNFSPDYLWNKHGENYYKICNDFKLTPTNAIQLALRDGHPVGVSPLLRYLDEQ